MRHESPSAFAAHASNASRGGGPGGRPIGCAAKHSAAAPNDAAAITIVRSRLKISALPRRTCSRCSSIDVALQAPAIIRIGVGDHVVIDAVREFGRHARAAIAIVEVARTC